MASRSRVLTPLPRILAGSVRRLRPLVKILLVCATLAASAAGPLTGCATNPATGEKQLSLVGTQQEIAMGRQASQEVAASIGLYDDPGLQAYVARVGDSLAARSERPELPWTFGVVDDPAVNAFALPGGFIYVTRGILAHLDSEAELAAVLGHEIGHVTARHSVERISKAQLANVGLGVGSILSSDIARFGDLANAGLGLLFLKYSRDDERQADDLGLRYAIRGGYDPRPMTDVFTLLERVSQLQQASRVPDWLASHPSPENRRALIAAKIDSTRSSFEGTRVDRDRHLREIDGVVFGLNPREGFFRANVFYHPDLRFQLEFPRGWKTANQKQQVLAVSPRQDAIVGLALAKGGSAEAAARTFASQQGLRTSAFRRGDLNGLSAASAEFEARTQQGTLRGAVVFVEDEGRVYQLLGYTAGQLWGGYQREIGAAIASFDRLTDQRILAIQPQRLEIVKLPSAMTVEQFAARYPADLSRDMLAVINQVRPGDRLEAGTLMKTVAGEDVSGRSPQ
ncbi:MAG: M48 family metalloprotease [Gemmatimonadetes bacterium]|nr:M48 family metalloprotease [Gemmatimonadota bacterium]